MEPSKIVVVDDDPDIIKTICFSLRQEGYVVISARNGWEALGAVRANEPDLVILDVVLPEENGYRVSGFIKSDVKKGVYSKNIIIMLLTGRVVNDPEELRMLIEFSQADLMLYKPFDMQKLISKVQELLAREKDGTHG